ncbi:MAG: tRNA(Ile)-lysidine synthetase [Proteobacteria bacterium]|nr:tRNA(Ile)-lysidine synthetase [Pseudomonadota bacterium]
MANSRSLQPDALVARVRERFARLPATDAPCALTVAFSGGLDSSVLLHVLAGLASSLGFRLSAIHVNHGLSMHAEAWARHCAETCAHLGVPLQVCAVEVARDAGRGLEAAARAVRYQALQQGAPGWIVLAHHADDQAETLLHRLLRGTGVAGAAAMSEVDAARRLWRPLLGETRETLLAWARMQGLGWIEDDSNADETLTRNFLRRQILAPLWQRFPASSANMLRATRHFAEATELLRELAVEDAAQVALGAAGARTRLCALSPARARNLLRFWIAQAGVLAPDAVRFEDLWQAVCQSGPMRWSHAGLALCAYHQALWWEPAEALPPLAPVGWRGEAILPWGRGELYFVPAVGAGALRLDPATACFQIRLRAGGECLRLSANRPTRSFKQLSQENGIPPWWREQVPMLWRADELVWIGGVGGAASVRAGAGEAGWQIAWRGPDGIRR